MAVAFEGFCIREFASKMRSADVVKSWPFGGDFDMEQIESALPPITVDKFRWWQHELEAARVSHASSSDAAAHLGEKSEEPLFGCTVCVGFRTSGNENADTQAEVANFEKRQSTRARSKSKAPKKRSIVEIFAVAPPIDTVARQEESSSGGNSDSTRVKKKKKKTAALKKRHLPILDRKLKKKVRRNASFAMKEICHKFKRKTASDLSRNFDRVRGKMCTSGTLEDADGICKSNPNSKPSSSQRKHKNIAPSKFITKKHKVVVSPVRGILKKQRKYVSGKDTATTVPEGTSQVADQLEKHVRFLVENDKIDGEANTHTVTTQQCNLHEILTDVDQLGRNGNSICMEELQVAKEKEITLPDMCGPGNLKNYLQVSTLEEDLNNFSELPNSSNHHIPKFCGDINAPTKGKSVVSDDASYPWHSRFFSTFNGASSNAGVAESSVRPISLSSEFISSQQVGPSSVVYGANSVPRTTNTSSKSASLPSLLLNENVNDQRLAFPSHSLMSNSSFIPLLCQPARCPNQMNSIGCSFSYKEWNPIGATSLEKSLNENLYGLPLNSRGELIQLSSSGNFMLDQQLGLPRRFAGQTAVQQRNASDSIRFSGNYTDKRSIPKDLNSFPVQVYADESPNSIPSREGMAEPRGTIMENSGGRVNINSSSHLFGKDLNLMSPSGEGSKVPSTTTPPVTMRLMGKDVSIGRNSSIGSEEEKVWTDKEIIVEHNNPSSPCFVKNFFPQDTVLNSFPEKSGGGLVNNISYGGQKTRNNSEYYRFPSPDPPRVRDPYINWQPDTTVQFGRVPITRCHQGGTISPIENVRDPYLNGGTERRLRAGSQIGTPFVPHESNWIDIQWGPEPRYRQNNVLAPRLPNSFGFPPDCRECFEESNWSRKNSFKEVAFSPPWPLHDTSEHTPYTHHHTLSPIPGRQQQHLYGTPANRLSSSSSSSSTTYPTFHLPEPYCCSYNPMASQSQMRSPLGVENVQYNNCRLDSCGFGFRRDHTRASKRPAVFDVGLRHPYKVPTLELQVLHPSIDLSLAREDTIMRNVEDCGAVLELDLHNGKETNRGFGGGLERNQRVSGRLKQSPGPTKLRAGAKHILKPCPNMEGNSGSI